ncbi:hypothetical protein HYW18_02595 [Candidatus Uhrbacteria bacterium]|nr:hypothetical protein [Candidatus Uhrbacteria bacterium]
MSDLRSRSIKIQAPGTAYGPPAFVDKIARSTVKDPDQITSFGFRPTATALLLVLVTIPLKLIDRAVSVTVEYLQSYRYFAGIGRTRPTGMDYTTVFALDDKIDNDQTNYVVSALKRALRWAGFDGLTYGDGRSNKINMISRGAKVLGLLVGKKITMIALPFTDGVSFTWTVTGDGWIAAAIVGSRKIWTFGIMNWVATSDGNWTESYETQSPIKMLSKCWGENFTSYSVSTQDEIIEIDMKGGKIKTGQTTNRVDLPDDLRNLDVLGVSTNGNVAFCNGDETLVIDGDSLQGTQFQAAALLGKSDDDTTDGWSASTTGPTSKTDAGKGDGALAANAN